MIPTGKSKYHILKEINSIIRMKVKEQQNKNNLGKHNPYTEHTKQEYPRDTKANSILN